MKITKNDNNQYNIINDNNNLLNEYDYDNPEDALNTLRDKIPLSPIQLKTLRKQIKDIVDMRDFLVIQDGKEMIITANSITVKPEYTILGDFVAVISHQATIIDLNKTNYVSSGNKVYRDES